jgi:hypothetical protein
MCGLTHRSAATPHGKPLGRRGALVYAAPRRPSALPRGSRLAQTLGLASQMQRQPRLHASAPSQSSSNFSSEASLALPSPAKKRASRLALRTHLRARKSGQEAAITNSLKPQRSIAALSTRGPERASVSTSPNLLMCFKRSQHELKALSAHRHGSLQSLSGSAHATSTAPRARPNPSLSLRPTAAGRLARAAPWFILHRTGKPSCRSGRG